MPSCRVEYNAVLLGGQKGFSAFAQKQLFAYTSHTYMSVHLIKLLSFIRMFKPICSFSSQVSIILPHFVHWVFISLVSIAQPNGACSVLFTLSLNTCILQVWAHICVSSFFTASLLQYGLCWPVMMLRFTVCSCFLG